MAITLLQAALALAASLTMLMAGVYFAFSTFVMKALAQLPAHDGIKAMNLINDVILRTAFMPLFFGSSLLCAGLGIWQIVEWQSPQWEPTPWQAGTSPLMLPAALIYLVGMFAVTAAGNVPLNRRLQRADQQFINERSTEQDSTIGQSGLWQHYIDHWTRLNHIRTASSLLAGLLFILALHNV